MTKPAKRLREVADEFETFRDCYIWAKDGAALLDECERALERAQDHLYNPFEPGNQCAAYHDVTATLAKLRGEQ